MESNKAVNQLQRVDDRLIEQSIIYDGKIMLSRRGVPYLWLDHHNQNISVCYFGREKLFKIWTGCGTSENSYYKTVKLWMDIIPEIYEILIK